MTSREYEFSESRVNREGLKDIKKPRDQGCLIRARIPGGFDEPRQLMGAPLISIGKPYVYAFYNEQPNIDQSV